MIVVRVLMGNPTHLIALVGGISDIAENLSILATILTFPQRPDSLAWFLA